MIPHDAVELCFSYMGMVKAAITGEHAGSFWYTLQSLKCSFESLPWVVGNYRPTWDILISTKVTDMEGGVEGSERVQIKQRFLRV